MKLTALLTNLRKEKLFSSLLWLGGIAVISLASFYFWKNYYSSSAYLLPDSVYAVELPKEIKKEDLANLTPELKERLDQQIFQVVGTGPEERSAARETIEMQTIVVVLTEGGRPILPDLTPAPQEQLPSVPPPTATTALPTEEPGQPTATITPVAQATATNVPVSPTLTPTLTPVPTNVPCFDSDGGKNINVKGFVTAWGETLEDECYSISTNETLPECSDQWCRILEKSCQPEGWESEAFKCEFGCQNGACVRASEGCGNGIAEEGEECDDGNSDNRDGCNSDCEICAKQGMKVNIYGGEKEQCCEGLVKQEIYCNVPYEDREIPGGDIEFLVSEEVKNYYQDEKGRDMGEDLEKIYQEAKKIYGQPFRGHQVVVKGSEESLSFYNASLNEIVLMIDERGTDFSEIKIISLILSAFHDDLIAFMPENWETGMNQVATIELIRRIYVPGYSYIDNQAATYELINSPVLANKDGRLSDGEPLSRINYQSLARSALYKPYLEDDQFFAKLNQAIYQQAINVDFKNRLLSVTGSVCATVEGLPSSDWLARQYVLQTSHLPGKYLFLEITSGVTSAGEVLAPVRAVKVQSDGEEKPTNNIGVDFKGYNSDGEEVFSYQAQTKNLDNFSSAPGYVDWKLPLLSGYTGSIKFEIKASGFQTLIFYYPYQTGQPIPPNRGAVPKVFGSIVNRQEGTLLVKTPQNPTETEYSVTNGMFSFPTVPGERGSIQLSYKNPDGETEMTKSITKYEQDYYTTVLLAPEAGMSRGSGQAPVSSPAQECDFDSWHNYYSDNFEFEAQYPPGWDTQEGYTYDLIDQTRLALVSTTDSASLLDQSAKHSFFDVIASKTDLKTDENYGRWFENNTGTQTTSQGEILGRQAEKYLDETDMPGGKHRNVLYYFKEGNNYYLISLAYYITPDVKQANEQIADCFLTTIKLRKPEPTPEGGIYKCSQGMYLTFEEFEQSRGEIPEGRCDYWNDKQAVCGKTRLRYDNGKMSDYWEDYDDACVFCASFDQSGSKTLRGTKIYNLGYKKGPCPN